MVWKGSGGKKMYLIVTGAVAENSGGGHCLQWIRGCVGGEGVVEEPGLALLYIVAVIER